MKKHLIIFAALIFVFKLNSDPLQDFVRKFTLFYASQFSATLIHELGHSTVANARNFNPKIVIGKIANAADYDLNNSFITIDSSLNPNCGVTLSNRTDCIENDDVKLNRNIIQMAMGPTFGILARILQLILINHFQDKIGTNLYNSLKRFIAAKLIQQFIYGFTPFQEKGDGKNLYVMLKEKYSSLIFENIEFCKTPFNIARDKAFQILMGYYTIYILFKFFKKNGDLDHLTQTFDNKFTQAISAYLMDYAAIKICFKTKKDDQTKNKNFLDWFARLFIESLIF